VVGHAAPFYRTLPGDDISAPVDAGGPRAGRAPTGAVRDRAAAWHFFAPAWIPLARRIAASRRGAASTRDAQQTGDVAAFRQRSGGAAGAVC
jgi:hypothetical protein